jgi:formate hydrogenlyase subunit 5
VIRPAENRVLTAETLEAACGEMLADGGRMQMAWSYLPPEEGDPQIFYLASPGARRPFVVWQLHAAADTGIPSLAQRAPLLGWYEREISDLFGVRFEGHPEPRPLVLHAGAQPACPPLDPRCPEQGMAFTHLPPTLPTVTSPDVQLLPFGPVRADVVESARFFFFYIGEHILHYQPQLFFKHRGMEKRFEGRDPSSAVVLAERVSGVGSVAHALGYCQAVEAMAAIIPPERALRLRLLLAELERLYNHFHYLGHLADTTTLKVGQAEGKLLEEQAKQVNARLTGSRFLRGLLVPGGLRRDLSPGPELGQQLGALQRATAEYVRALRRTTSIRDRLHDTGILDWRTAFDQGATGPVERASGLDRDLRRDHPYAAYADADLRVPVETAGDAYARAVVRMGEIDASFELILRLLPKLGRPESVRVHVDVPAGAAGLGWAESPRGSLYYAVHCDAEGRLARVKIKSPSFSNWRVFPYTVYESNMMDYAINEASFGLTIAGCDR